MKRDGNGLQGIQIWSIGITIRKEIFCQKNCIPSTNPVLQS